MGARAVVPARNVQVQNRLEFRLAYARKEPECV